MPIPKRLAQRQALLVPRPRRVHIALHVGDHTQMPQHGCHLPAVPEGLTQPQTVYVAGLRLLRVTAGLEDGAQDAEGIGEAILVAQVPTERHALFDEGGRAPR